MQATHNVMTKRFFEYFRGTNNDIHGPNCAAKGSRRWCTFFARLVV